MKKTIKTRIITKHETQANWEKAVNFVPLQAEIVVYDADSTHTQPRLKIGDGIKTVNELPFFGNTPIATWGQFLNENTGYSELIWGIF